MTQTTRTSRSTHPGAFTLVELMVTLAIIGLMLGVVTLAFRRLSESSALTTAAATLTTYAAAARAYAIDNNIEAMMIVNPYNGRMELWHLNPPTDGAPWDPYSDAQPNGYRYASVWDSTVSLPLDPENKPLVVVHPIDFDAKVDGSGTPLRGTTDNQRYRDNLNWVAVCFDASGRLVQRMRRIATRMPTDFTGAPVANANRRADGTPDIANTAPQYQVDANDSLITSTRGFIVSERKQFEAELPNPQTDQTPNNLVNVWLPRTEPDGKFGRFARHVVLSPWSGRELTAAEQ